MSGRIGLLGKKDESVAVAFWMAVRESFIEFMQ